MAKSNLNKKESRKAKLEIKRLKKLDKFYEDDDSVVAVNGGIAIKTKKIKKEEE